MMVHRHFTPSDLMRRRAIKAALRSLHEGPGALPRKAVWMVMGKSEATYSRWLRDESPELPDPLELMEIVSITNNPAPLQAMAMNSGAGYRVEVDGAMESPARESMWQLLLTNMSTAHAADLELTRSLEDELLEPHEAAVLAPKLKASIEARRKALEVAERILNTDLSEV